MRLAKLKAQAVFENEPDAIVIGGDQVLAVGNEVLHKPGNLVEARAQLQRLSGRTHELAHRRRCVCKWDAEDFVDTGRLTMRDFTDEVYRLVSGTVW